MTKITGSGSISQRHGSADPDPVHSKMSWIRNTGVHHLCLYVGTISQVIVPLSVSLGYREGNVRMSGKFFLISRPSRPAEVYLELKSLKLCRISWARRPLVALWCQPAWSLSSRTSTLQTRNRTPASPGGNSAAPLRRQQWRHVRGGGAH
jgi:hypothetical protein